MEGRIKEIIEDYKVAIAYWRISFGILLIVHLYHLVVHHLL